jgi:hypothetical protein
MSDQSLVSEETISNKIYFIRNQKEMLDSDLALLYGVDTKRLNEQVKRNDSRFPLDFMFQLAELEFRNLKSQNATSSWGGTRKLPFAFTEHGVLMLSSVLRSERAIQTNSQIMRIFTKVRQLFLDTTEIKIDILQIQKKLENHYKNIELVFSYLDELTEKKGNEKDRVKIGFKK